MENIDLVNFRRAIMHEIHKKTRQREASVEASNELIELTDDVLDMIKTRLNTALSKRTRCFEMEIRAINRGSFYNLCNGLNNEDDREFINRSIEIADLLAESQNNLRIGGGFFIFIEGCIRSSNKPIYTVIKADPQEALSKDNLTGRVNVLKDIFLSPAQKLYKIGVLVGRDNLRDDLIEPNNRYECFVFDEQFNISDSIPATYFFDTFLGFSANKNSKIITKRFYDKAADFINEEFEDASEKQQLLAALKSGLETSVSPLFSPLDFGNTYIEDTQIKNRYAAEVLSEYPISFTKDLALLTGTFRQSNMIFPNKIKISGPAIDFDNCISTYSSIEELENADISGNYTILLVKGKPKRNA